MSFSLRWLFVAVAFVAIIVVALLNANPYWAGAARSTLFFMLSIGIVVAIASTGATRVFWMGFSIVGAIQFWSLGFAQGEASGYLLTEQLIEWLHPKITREVTVPANPYNTLGTPKTTQVVELPYQHDFRPVAICVICAVVGVLGGYIGKWVYGRSPSKGSGQ